MTSYMISIVCFFEHNLEIPSIVPKPSQTLILNLWIVAISLILKQKREEEGKLFHGKSLVLSS